MGGEPSGGSSLANSPTPRPGSPPPVDDDDDDYDGGGGNDDCVDVDADDDADDGVMPANSSSPCHGVLLWTIRIKDPSEFKQPSKFRKPPQRL